MQSKRRTFWLWILAIAALAVITAVLIGPFDGAGADADRSANIKSTYGARAGQSVSYGGGITVSAEALRPSASEAGRLCSAVSIHNGGQTASRFSYSDWKLQVPGGLNIEADHSDAKSHLGSAELPAGGGAAGDVCFGANPGKSSPPGTYVVVLEPAPGSGQRIAWVNSISG